MPTLTLDHLLKYPYQQFIDTVLHDAPKNTTRIEVSDWLASKYSAHDIALMYIKLYDQLTDFVLEGQNNDLQANHLRDQMDIFWFAGDADIADQAMEARKYGCPCSESGCCANPDVFCPEHICVEDVCEECFVSKCRNCGNSCCCDL